MHRIEWEFYRLGSLLLCGPSMICFALLCAISISALLFMFGVQMEDVPDALTHFLPPLFSPQALISQIPRPTIFSLSLSFLNATDAVPEVATCNKVGPGWPTHPVFCRSLRGRILV
jgi:hypothetical protein